MKWSDDLLALSRWAMQSEDLRHRFIHADTPLDLVKTPGIANSLETNVVFAIYEAAVAKGYKRGKTIAYERPYPDFTEGNPKRSDLAFKDPGKGQNWAYVEVKYYGANGKDAVGKDIAKLKSIEKKSQRWVLCYRVKPTAGKSPRLKSLLGKHFRSQLDYYGIRSLYTVTTSGTKGICEIVLARVK
jgi:hypothetical protein